LIPSLWIDIGLNRLELRKLLQKDTLGLCYGGHISKGFAVGANRQQIAKCSEIGLELDELIELGIEAMKEIAKDLGL